MARRLGYLAVLFLAISTTTFAQVVQGVATSGPAPVIDVKAYGAKGDGSTDDSSAINTAISKCPASSGCTIFFPAGSSYNVGSGLTIAAPAFGMKLLGECGANVPQNGGLLSCSHLVSSTANATLLTVGASGTKSRSGLVIEDLGFSDVSAGNNLISGGLDLVNTEDFTLIDIHCENIKKSTGFCLLLDGGNMSGNTQFGVIINPTTNQVQFPIQAQNSTSEINIYGGNIMCNLTVGGGSVGIDLNGTTHTGTVDYGGEWGIWGGHIGNCDTGLSVFNNQINFNSVLEQTGSYLNMGTGVLLDGGSATGVTCMVGTGTSCMDITHTASVTPGQGISVRVTGNQGSGETLSSMRVGLQLQ